MSKRFLISKDVAHDLYQNNCRAVVMVNLPNDIPAGIKDDIIADLDNSKIIPRKKHDPDWNRMTLGFETSNIALEAKNQIYTFLYNIGMSQARLHIIKLHQ
ncbi:MAG: hypothetical protein Q8T08_22525 [Ignavibacteria bacterium]|nr:hypothetical protein [Ignavibacteria bacterium]